MFELKLLVTPDGDQDRGPSEDTVHRIDKANGRVVVAGPIALGHESRVVHAVTGGLGVLSHWGSCSKPSLNR